MSDTDARRCTRNAPYRAIFPLRNTADALVSAAGGLQSFVSVDSATFGATTNTVTEIGSTGIYYLDISITETQGDASTTVYVTSSDSTPTFFNLDYEPDLESGQLQSASATTATLRATAPAPTNLFNGCQIEIVGGTGIGQARTITNYNSDTKIVTVDRAWTTNPAIASVYAIRYVGIQHGTDIIAKVNAEQIGGSEDAATMLGEFSEGMFVSSSINDASPTTSSWECSAGLNVTDDFYNTAICLFTSGSNVGLARQVIDWDGDNLLITTNAFPAAPANADTFALFGKVF